MTASVPSRIASPFGLVATLGPRSRHLISDLADAGCTALRLNASHMEPGELASVAEEVCGALPAMRIVVDLQGAKMRLDRNTRRQVVAGERIAMAYSANEPAEALVVPHRELYEQIRVGETISLDDGRVRLRVDGLGPQSLVGIVLEGGLLVGRKGVNIVEHPVDLDDLSPSDRAAIHAVGAVRTVDWALSFVKDAQDVSRLRRVLTRGSVVAKIERAEAVERLEDIAAAADALWICRGDLGAQIGEGRLARFVGEWRPRRVSCSVLMAGQVLEHLTRHARPTRSEVCHLYDLWKRGYAGIVLSDETAVGEDPVRAVAHARRLLDELAQSDADR